MTTPSCPYKADELFNSENKNIRNVHNDVNKYMRNVMGLTTPLTKETRPSLDAIKDSIMNAAKLVFELRRDLAGQIEENKPAATTWLVRFCP